jgi:nitroreductase
MQDGNSTDSKGSMEEAPAIVSSSAGSTSAQDGGEHAQTVGADTWSRSDPVLSRRSIRSYTEQPVAEETVRILLEAAMAAPSADDERPWHFIVVRDRQIREQIPDIHHYAHMVAQAPVAIVVCGDETLQKQPGCWVQDCSAATENILIEAQQLGLGAVWLGIYPVEGRVQSFRRLLKLPSHVTPLAIIAVGRPAERKEPSNRYDASRVHFDCW